MTSILVVDDTADAADALASIFEAHGHEVHVACDGLQGVAAAKRHRPHIIFLDLDMPVLDGFGAAKAIRAFPATDRPFIVALTARIAADVRACAEEAWFDSYLLKPAATSALLALVDALPGRLLRTGLASGCTPEAAGGGPARPILTP